MADTTEDHKLVVSLEARIRTYEKAIQKAHSETSRHMKGIENALKGPRAEMARFERAGTTMAAGFSKHVATASTALSGFARGVLAGGALAALGSFTGAIAKARSAIADFDQISNSARTVGLSGETFQALSFGAVEAGISQEKLNAALGIFTKNAGLAKVGSGTLATELKKLNPELLKSLVAAEDQETRLKLVADAMLQTSDATQKAALATTIFGKGGLEMVLLLDRGAAALAEFKRRGAELGVIIPDDLLQRAGVLDDRLEVLSKVIDVNLSTALVKLAPLLVGASEGAASFAIEVNRLSEAVDQFQRNPDLDSFLDIFNVKLIEGGIADRFRDFINAGLAESKRTSGEIQSEIAAIEATIADLQSLGSGAIFAEIAIKQETARLAELRAELRRVEISMAAAAKNGGAALGDLAASASAALDEVRESVNAQATEAEKYESVMAQINAAAAGLGGTGFAQQSQDLADYIERSRGAVAATETIAQAQEQLSIIARGALADITGAAAANSLAYQDVQRTLDGIVEGLTENSLTADGLIGRLKEVETSLRAMGVGESVISQLVSAFGTLAGSIFNAKAALDAYNQTKVGASGVRTDYDVGGGSSVGVTRFSSEGAQQAPSAPTLKQINVEEFLAGARAAGGPVKKGKSYLVGEEGPEIFTPDSTGAIIPNDEISRASSFDQSNPATVPSGQGSTVLQSGAQPEVGDAAPARAVDGHLKWIEDHTFQTVEELRRAIGYLQTIESDGQVMLGVMKGLRDALKASGGSGGYSSGAQPSGGSGGFASSSGGGSSGYSFSDPKSPYHYKPSVYPGGPQYDPVADFLFNGNQGALGIIAGRPAGMYDAIGPDVTGNRQPTNGEIAAQLGAAGPQVGNYGGGYNLSMDSDLLDGMNFFGSGSRFPSGGMGSKLPSGYDPSAYDPDIGFATGGIIHPGDSQRVSFFKNPNETVGIFTPQQMDAMSGEEHGGSGVIVGDIHVSVPPGTDMGSRQSQLAMSDEIYRAIKHAVGRP